MSLKHSEGFVKAVGYGIHYLNWGKAGEPMVLLHGSGCTCSAHDLEDLGNKMCDTHRIVAFDLIGHAQSEDPRTPIGFKEQVDPLREAAKKLNITRSTLVGWSYGGWLSMVWANQHPEEVEKLVLIDIPPVTFSKPTPQDPEDVPAYFRDEKEAAEHILARFPVPRVWLEKHLKRFPRSKDGRVVTLSHRSRRVNLRKDLDLWEIFRGINVPILLVYGSDSKYLPQSIVDKMREANSRLDVVGVKGAGHFLPLTHPEDYIGAVKEWVAFKS
jgi:pimeloyl-ACP methyl ester carboxylesterase